ncbi:restriction endonuclease subunit S [Trueperella pyogenes]
MSHIQHLINELCPDGVKYQAISALGSVFSGLRGKSKADFEEGNAKFATYRDVFDQVKLLKVSGLVKVSDGELQNSLRLGDVIITGSSENIDEVAYTSVVTRAFDEPTYLNSFCFGIRLNHPEMFEPDFLAHLLRSSDVRTRFTKTANGVTRYNVSKPALLKVRIPVPPLEVQREIVRILDGFTKLEAELEAELEARRKQYAFYRDQLLTFIPERGRTKWLPLGNLGRWVGGGTPPKANPDYWSSEGYPWVSPKDLGLSIDLHDSQDHITERALTDSPVSLVPEGSIAIVARSSILFKRLPATQLRVSATLNQDMKALIVNSGADSRYVLHSILAHSEQILHGTRKRGGSVASLEFSKLKKFKIPVPPLEEQRRIVAILDKFEALVNDISSGLPAEIEARRKQYEHYRDRLLTFPELNG